MNNKLRQVTDKIHGTIYLSALESEFISTPYFYRLHDIYQSSTVYMTYPANRTKRYEHSLGTMEIASNMLFSAVSNADKACRIKFFNELFATYKKVFEAVISFHDENAAYLHKTSDCLDELFDFSDKMMTPELFFKTEVKNAYDEGVMEDRALDQFQFYSISTKQDRDLSGMRDCFLYRCVLEAVRIVALFHDVGHPPYSHIIEDAINNLYSKIEHNSEGYIAKRVLDFKKALDPFISKDSKKAFSCKMILSKSSLIDAHTHERIGLALVQSAINEVLPEQIKEIYSSKSISDSVKRTLSFYYIFVAEMVVAILTEVTPFFKSLHTILDGYVDADRLDYIVRDSVNSGVDWGKIPYKRLIQSCKLFYLSELYKKQENYFSIAFQKKSADDITDMLVTRYKIFARINLHHRCIKTSSTLKACVEKLSIDYLLNDNSVCPDIRWLWESLSTAKAGNIGMRIIQWNDSWLISSLHKALVNISQHDNEHVSLRENLEEILLNKKRYYCLLKRGDDQRFFVTKVFKAMNIKMEDINRLNEHEQEKIKKGYEPIIEKKENDISYEIDEENIGENVENLFSEQNNALDSLERVNMLDVLLEYGDLELLNSILALPTEEMQKVFNKTLEDLYAKKIIRAYQVYVNKDREKIGVPSHDTPMDNIFLYSEKGTETYNENLSLLNQLGAIENSVPVLNIYYIPSEIDRITEIGNQIIDLTAKSLGEQYIKRKKEIFNNAI